MDIEGRLHSEQRRSHITMMKFVQTVNADRLSDDESIRGRVRSQFAAGLRAVLNQGQPQGQINAVRVGATGNLYLLIDQKDGVRVLETDPSATNILNQAQIGAKGDIGLALALDPAGNVYVTGTTTSGSAAHSL